MRVRFKDEIFEFNADRFLNVELMEVERVSRDIGYPLTGFQWQNELNSGGITALTLLFYLLKKRKNPTFQFADMPDFDSDDFDLNPPTEEIIAEPAPLVQTNVDQSGLPIYTRDENLTSSKHMA